MNEMRETMIFIMNIYYSYIFVKAMIIACIIIIIVMYLYHRKTLQNSNMRIYAIAEEIGFNIGYKSKQLEYMNEAEKYWKKFTEEVE